MTFCLSSFIEVVASVIINFIGKFSYIGNSEYSLHEIKYKPILSFLFLFV